MNKYQPRPINSTLDKQKQINTVDQNVRDVYKILNNLPQLQGASGVVKRSELLDATMMALDSSLNIASTGFLYQTGAAAFSKYPFAGSGSTFINGSNNTLDFFSPDAGASVRLRQLVGGVMIDSGWEVDVQTVTPPGGADKIVAMYIDGTLLLPVVVWDDGLGGVPTIPSSALQVRNIYVDAISIQFVIVWDDGL